MREFKLRSNLCGHEKDVRCVCASYYPECGVISGSRDLSARVWAPNEHDSGFMEGHIMSGHSGFVSAVCVLPPTKENPRGFIVTGSNDHNINVYNLESPLPLYTLQGHTDTVCTLTAGKTGTLLSGSWDQTAKVWMGRTNLMTLSGHSLAVWCVAMMPASGVMLTGSADKTIKIWKQGKCEHTLHGHDDCVRGLAVISAQEFLSCSNDSTIRRWTISGHVLQVYYNHSNYVYSLATFPDTEDFVSVGEDRTLKIWENGDCVQTITHPCTSVWSVCVLSNGDVVTGGSDGLIRVFTCDPSRFAPDQEREAFEKQVSSSQIPIQVGDVDISKLKGLEALDAPGKKDGATVMIRIGTNVEAHQWSASEMRWNKVGDVVGASANSSGRTLHEGKEYDFVFSVEVEEGKPSLTLPYNMTEDPWQAAQNFIVNNGLSQVFLEQVHDFIVKNSKSNSMVQLPADESYADPFTGGGRYVPGNTAMDTDGSYADPFTGAGRYVPPAGDSVGASSTVQAQGADPFTGGGSYRPAEAVKSVPKGNPYYPQKEVLGFKTGKPEAAIAKLKEFNKKLPGPLRCEDNDLQALIQLCDEKKTPSTDMLSYLWRILNWPQEYVFPAIDLWRAAVCNNSAAEYYCSTSKRNLMLEYLARNISNVDIPQNQFLALRVLSNLTLHDSGKDLFYEKKDNLIPLVLNVGDWDNKNMQVGASTVILNLAVILKQTEDMDAKSEAIRAALDLAEKICDYEAKFRLCVALGTLTIDNPGCKAMASSLGAEKFLKSWQNDSDPKTNKLKECCSYLLQDLASG